MIYCRCFKPEPAVDPRHERTCVKCGHSMAPFDQSDENFRAFWDRIESSYPGYQYPLYEPPDEQQTLRLQTTHREKAGRAIFGYEYLSPERDNIREAREELADALLYVYLDTLKNVRDGDDPEWDVVLEIADDLLSAYGKLNQLKHKHRGAPA